MTRWGAGYARGGCAIKADIAKNLHSPDLSIGAVARRLEISPDYIGKLGALFACYLYQ
jgi:hypothetical protein